MSSTHVVYNPSNGLKWVVRLVRQGDKYGLDFCLTHKATEFFDEPLVEFYDARLLHTEFGQFVSRYYLHTVLEVSMGLDLNSDVGSWYLDAEAMSQVHLWLHDVCKDDIYKLSQV